MTIVDTTVWIDYLGGTVNPHTDWLDRELNQQRLGLTDLVLCEILQGIRADPDFTRVRRDLSRFEVFDTGGAALAVASAQNYRFQLSLPSITWSYGSEDDRLHYRYFLCG